MLGHKQEQGTLLIIMGPQSSERKDASVNHYENSVMCGLWFIIDSVHFPGEERSES